MTRQGKSVAARKRADDERGQWNADGSGLAERRRLKNSSVSSTPGTAPSPFAFRAKRPVLYIPVMGRNTLSARPRTRESQVAYCARSE